MYCQDSANTFSKKSSPHLTCCAPTPDMSFFLILFIQSLVCHQNNVPGECMTMWQSSILLSKRSSLAHTHRCLTHVRSYDKGLPKERIIHNRWRNTIPDKGLTPTFYKFSFGRCPHQHSLTVPRHGRFTSVLPTATRTTGVSSWPPTDIRLRFPDTTTSWIKVFCRLSCAHGFLPALPKNAFNEDHTMLVVILCTVWQSFPCQLFFQCWGPSDILHWTFISILFATIKTLRVSCLDTPSFDTLSWLSWVKVVVSRSL